MSEHGMGGPAMIPAGHDGKPGLLTDPKTRNEKMEKERKERERKNLEDAERKAREKVGGAKPIGHDQPDVPAGTHIEPRIGPIPDAVAKKMMMRRQDMVRDLSASEIMQLMILSGGDVQTIADDFAADKKRWPSDSDDDIMRRIYGVGTTPVANEEEKI